MYFEGNVTLPVDRPSLWEVIIDLEDLSQYIPGLQSIETITPGKEYRLVVGVTLGSMKQTFQAQARFASAEPPSFARLQIRGKSPQTHFGATSSVTLVDLGGGSTDMRWTFSVSIYGQVASLGTRTIENVVDKVTDRFLGSLRSRLGVPGSAPPTSG